MDVSLKNALIRTRIRHRMDPDEVLSDAASDHRCSNYVLIRPCIRHRMDPDEVLSDAAVIIGARIMY